MRPELSTALIAIVAAIALFILATLMLEEARTSWTESPRRNSALLSSAVFSAAAFSLIFVAYLLTQSKP